MARWRLTEQHYLKVPGTKWEYSEVNRVTGKPQRTQFDVPMHLNPNDSADWNHRNGNEGEIIVCHVGKGQPKDIEFIGQPTPDMIPLDDEAKAISAKIVAPNFESNEEFPMTFGERLLDDLTKQLADVQSKAAPATSQVEGMGELLTAMTAMMKQNQEMMTMLVGAQKPMQPSPKRL